MALMVIGWIAAVVHMSGYSHQSGKILKSRKTSSLALSAFMLNFLGSFTWGINGILLRATQPVLVNTIVLSTVAIIIYFILVQNFNWSKVRAIPLLIILLTIAWGIFTFHMIDMYSYTMVATSPLWLKVSIAVFAGTLSMVSFIPQLIKMIKTKDTKHVSYVLASCYGLANWLWVSFYILEIWNGNPLAMLLPTIIAGSLTGCVQVSILLTKYRQEKKMRKATN